MALRYPAAKVCQRPVRLRRLAYVGHNRQVVARLGSRQEAGDGAGGLHVGKPARFTVLPQPGYGLVLGLLDVGLVERVDAQDGPRNGGGKLPAEELGAQVVGVLQPQPRHGLPGSLDGRDGGVRGGVVVALQSQIDEQTVVAVASGSHQRLAGNRDDTPSLFASALCDELLSP